MKSDLFVRSVIDLLWLADDDVCGLAPRARPHVDTPLSAETWRFE